MIVRDSSSLSATYHIDETAWLDAMAELASQGRAAEMDLENLATYLSDMARRDRREVYSRLVVLISHLLKWERQPERRGGSWRGTILTQRRELRLLLESGTLRNHAAAVLADAYGEARRQAAAESELSLDVFPLALTQTLDEILSDQDPGAA